ncbi:MAG TPA: TetR/AcrR family transcriptional regulator [Acidimicrobiales bacterium]|nr:TetR/AcrR family transcriptional regulator [Acidimicrobiales bacterium]
MGQASGTIDADTENRSRDADTRRRILDAAIDCFTQFGNAKTSLNDVARVSGLTRQTIYRHFPGRSGLLEAVDQLEDQRLRLEVAAIGQRSRSFEDFVAGLVRTQVALAQRYGTRQHLIELDRGLFQALFLSHERKIARLREMVAPQLELAWRRGELHDAVRLDEAAEWVAISLAGVTSLTTATSFDLDDPVSVGRFFARHLCQGLVRSSQRPSDSP